jgi:hypothetical protein
VTGGTSSEALRQLLGTLPDRVPLHRLDRLWLFPPREVAGRETGLVVISLLPEDEPGGPRSVLTLRYEVRGTGTRRQFSDTLVEQGTAPAERISRIIDGVRQRLADDAADPAVHEIAGDLSRWSELAATLGFAQVDPGSGE